VEVNLACFSGPVLLRLRCRPLQGWPCYKWQKECWKQWS